MQYDSSKIEALREEISRMLARDIIVLNRAQAVKMAESLYAVTMVNSFIRWHTVEVNASLIECDICQYCQREFLVKYLRFTTLIALA